MLVSAGDVGTQRALIPLVQNSNQGDGFERFPAANGPIGNSLEKCAVSNFTSAVWRKILHSYLRIWDN